MPPPHDQKGAHAAPRQPVLSASAAKAMGRAPLTPKIASKAQQHHQQPPVVTPLARRKTDLGHGSAASGASGGPGGGVKDDITSPVSAFLSHNITPRSGSRQTRVDSASSTPTGTPNPERNSDWDTRSAFASAFDGDMNRKHVVTFSPPSDVGSRNDPPDSKFFYASDAKPASQPALHKTQQQQQQQPIKAPTFIYANGSAIERNRPTSPSVVPGFTPVLAPMQEAQASKFFYANGTPDFQHAYRPASAAGSTVSSSSKMNAPRAAPTIAPGGFAATSRPTSPNKQTQPIPPPLARTATLSPQPANRPQMASQPTLAAQPAAKRRVSIEVPPQHGSHSRTGSVSSGDAIIMSRFMASHPSSELSSPTSAPNNPAVTMASIIQAAEDLTESDDSKGHSELQSPTKSTHSGDPLNDLVAHARRERKVQDLEITNASLEAINRSLERQLRKQTAELRRYRRLSRSGRLSLTSMASSRVPSDSTVGTAVAMESGLELSDLSEDEGEDEEEEDDDLGSLYDTDPSDSESISSPGLKAADRRRKRDERRLQLDLTKHRELLVDSQKINQSIKRCLNWTEELIKDGKKALEYKVRVSDVELAPRVLAPQYEDDPDVLKSGDVGDDDGDITLSDSILDDVPPMTATLKGANLAPPWSGDPQIRDSGIDLPTNEG
ncbi:hypothetical protein HYQ45_001600 [Verticillium longisporum]|uniref:Uncharacterized protein n=1 Tax=Verticillium longisporum TaxID=100787 RepID=A0A8I3A0Z3_VERLO|nr:hypothetical protein HYQ45_001600 [Verticillium longisporum]